MVVAAKPDVDNKNSTQTAELITRNESHTELEFTGNQNLSEATTKDATAGDINISESFPDMACTSDKEKLEDDYVHTYLKNFPWYHGIIFSAMAEKLLKWEHAFLVRRTIVKSSSKILCLSLKVEDKVVHYQLVHHPDGWYCPKLHLKFPKIPPRKFTHIHELLDAWSLCVHFSVPVPRRKIVVQHESLILGLKLGKGAFGEVFKATFLPKDGSDGKEVAVKQIIGEANKTQIQDFCQECYIMSLLSHKNVVGLFGIATLKMPIILVMELVPGGDLKKYLQRTVNLSAQQILQFALDISRGMSHLALKKVIHRDLAARNCLITNSLQVKISDFGLSVQGVEVTVKNLKKAPIRWLAPETLAKGLFNEKTDVWAYGVLATELLCRCANDPLWPRDLKECQRWIKEADKPHHVIDSALEPKELIEIIDWCCDKIVERRPTFVQIKKRVAQIYEKIIEKQQVVAETAKGIDNLHTERRINNHGMSRKASNTTLLRKKSRDKNRTKERKTKGGRLLSFRRKDAKPKLPAGMSPTTPPTASTPPPDKHH